MADVLDTAEKGHSSTVDARISEPSPVPGNSDKCTPVGEGGNEAQPVETGPKNQGTETTSAPASPPKLDDTARNGFDALAFYMSEDPQYSISPLLLRETDFLLSGLELRIRHKCRTLVEREEKKLLDEPRFDLAKLYTETSIADSCKHQDLHMEAIKMLIMYRKLQAGTKKVDGFEQPSLHTLNGVKNWASWYSPEMHLHWHTIEPEEFRSIVKMRPWMLRQVLWIMSTSWMRRILTNRFFGLTDTHRLPNSGEVFLSYSEWWPKLIAAGLNTLLLLVVFVLPQPLLNAWKAVPEIQNAIALIFVTILVFLPDPIMRSVRDNLVMLAAITAMYAGLMGSHN